jgi:uncharacterized OsmC-like protein
MSNAIIKQAIEKTAAIFAADPKKAYNRNAPLVIRLGVGLQCRIELPNGQTFATDMPPPMGGQASGPNPGLLLRMGLGSCLATVIAMRAATLGITLDLLEVAVESESDSRGLLGMDGVPAAMSALRSKVKIAAHGVPPARLREVVEWADAHSPVGCTVRNPPALALEIETVGAD